VLDIETLNVSTKQKALIPLPVGWRPT